MAEKRILTTGQLARYCGVDHRTILRWIKQGHIRAFQLPGRGDHRVPAEECVRFMEAHGIPIPDELIPVRSRRVLIVEDDEDLKSYLEILFRRAEFDVRSASDGFAAGAMLGTFRPALLVLDLNIPLLNGIDVLKHVRVNPTLAGTKVIVISGMAQKDLDNAKEQGADAIMRKPIDEKKLIQQAEDLIGSPRAAC